MILDQAFRYISELKKQNDTMLLEGGDKVQGEVFLILKLYFNLWKSDYTACRIINI